MAEAGRKPDIQLKGRDFALIILEPVAQADGATIRGARVR